MKALFLNNIPSPYRINFFNELGKYCDLTVLFERHSASDRDKRWQSDNYKNFEAVFLKGKAIGADGSLSLEYRKYFKKKSFDIVVLAGYSSPTGILAFLHCKIHGIPYIVSSDGAFERKESFLKHSFKKLLLSKAVAGIGTTDETLRYLNSYNVVRTYKYPFTSLFKSDLLKSIPTESEKDNLRKKLKIPEKKIVLSVGQFIYRKGYDILIKAFLKIKNADIGLYIIGGTPTQEYVELRGNNKNIHFVDFMSKNKLKEYYEVADLFVLPTREDIWGLVINEAMACALPVITTDRCGAGMELVKNEENGFFVHSEDIEELYKRINTIIENPILQKTMSAKSLNIIQDFTIEKMAERHMEIFQQLCKK